MGILNLTPDSFFDGGQLDTAEAASKKAEQMLQDGASILDLGAYSSRPGADDVSIESEWTRLKPALKLIRKKFPKTILSIDTFRSEVARIALQEGADLINDISGGKLDSQMIPLVIEKKVPYCAMHMQGTPQNMQENPSYKSVVHEVYKELSNINYRMSSEGFSDLILDPGFGFGKSLEHNYELLDSLELFSALGRPILVGFSRKSMINKVLKVSKLNSLNGTSILNTIALVKGASILRVHDVKEATEAVKLFSKMSMPKRSEIDTLQS